MYWRLLTPTLISLNKLHQRKHMNNQAFEAIRLQKIINQTDIIKTLPYNLKEKESIPSVIYNLGYTVRNNILNYKDVVNSIYIDE